jgi:hypothetical protein
MFKRQKVTNQVCWPLCEARSNYWNYGLVLLATLPYDMLVDALVAIILKYVGEKQNEVYILYEPGGQLLEVFENEQDAIYEALASCRETKCISPMAFPELKKFQPDLFLGRTVVYKSNPKINLTDEDIKILTRFFSNWSSNDEGDEADETDDDDELTDEQQVRMYNLIRKRGTACYYICRKSVN